MKHSRFINAIMLFIVLMLPVTAQAASTRYTEGDTIRDFTFTTYDGMQYSLYEVLQEKEAVLINIWASWCSPCRREFPFMQEAYEEYRDRVEVIALSCEATDTPEKLATFAAENGLTFPIGQAPQELLNDVGVSSIPVSLMIDRFGTICFMEAGAQPDTDSFRRLFEAFLGDDYPESLILDAIPAEMPNVAPADPAELSAALGCKAFNPTNRLTWPMIVTEKDGRQVLASTNAGKTSSRAEVTAEIDAKAGDAILVTFKTSTEPLFDLLTLSVNGRTVKHFGGEHDWMTYAVPVDTDGKQTVKIAYAKDSMYDTGDDTIWVDSIVLADDPLAALSANPVYPIGAATEMVVTNPDAKEVIISDPYGLLAANFGSVRCYIVNEDTATVRVHLAADVDPECALVYFSYNQAQVPALQIMTDDGYSTSTKVDSTNITDSYCTFAAIYPDVRIGAAITTLLFRDEENLDGFVTRNSLDGWHYSDADEDVAEPAPTGPVAYTILCIDQDGGPVANALLQVCNDEVCQVFMTDSEGKATFEAEAYPWEIHVLQAPDMYEVDPSQIALAPVEGGEVIILLTKK